MGDEDPDDLYSLQEVVGESEDRPPLEVVNLTAETEVPTDQAEDKPAPENVEPIPVCEPLREIDPLAGHRVGSQHCICFPGRIKRTRSWITPSPCWVAGILHLTHTCLQQVRSTAIQTTSLILSESSDKESSGSDATWGWCSDRNDQGRAEQVA